MASDSFDELAVHDDLLRASIDFFMHKKTIYIFWILLVYTTLLSIGTLFIVEGSAISADQISSIIINSL